MTQSNTSPDYFLIDQWESWIEEDQQNDQLINLYVFGEIYWNDKRIRPALVRRLAQPHNLTELHLEIRPAYLWDTGVVTEVRYSETIRKERAIQKVNIYIGDILLVSIDTAE